MQVIGQGVFLVDVVCYVVLYGILDFVQLIVDFVFGMLVFFVFEYYLGDVQVVVCGLCQQFVVVFEWIWQWCFIGYDVIVGGVVLVDYEVVVY